MRSQPASEPRPRSEAELAALCLRLGARRVRGLSPVELALAAPAARVAGELVRAAAALIRAGGDPLGDWFCALRPPERRRARGAVYTPAPVVEAMVAWGAAAAAASRVVDPGAGSGRFLLAAARALPRARLIGVEVDPLAALMARANLATAGHARRAEIHLGDYRAFRPGATRSPTLFVGNPPYVRHHDIEPRWKEWLAEAAARRGLRASRLSGLHVHFFLATLDIARAGDVGALITAGEWLDVNYGALVRDLLAGPLGLERIEILDPRVEPFEGAQATAVITCFRIGSAARSARVRRVGALGALGTLDGGRRILRARLADEPRWTSLTRRDRPRHDLVELGELCRVHRGQVTGANSVWIAGAATPAVPAAFLAPSVTRARELFGAGPALCGAEHLRRVVDLPPDLDHLSRADRRLVDRFLRWACESGADRAYVARHRTPWWSVRLRAPAPILATYMARRPPAFVRNLAGARHVNIAHGIYPRDPMPAPALDALAAHLAATASVASGRTYAGGLTKFEPKEMERLLVPPPAVLAQLAACDGAPGR